MDTRAMNGELLEFLNAAGCKAKISGNASLILYHEALRICNDNRPGNFLVLSGDTESLMLAWMIRNKTIQPRNLFIRKSSYERFAAHFKALGRGIWVKPVDELLEEMNHARNWLGMLDLVYCSDTSTASTVAKLLMLVSDQLMDGARIVIKKGNDANDDLERQLSPLKLQYYQPLDQCLVISWQRHDAEATDIPPMMIQEFKQDDPVAAGIPTMMSSNERFQLYYAIRSLLPQSLAHLRFIEVGSFAGGTFYEVCMSFKRMALPFQGISIEPSPGEIFLKVIDFFKENVIHLPMKSHDAAVLLAEMFEHGRQPVFILIDGDHSYEAVLQDIRDYYPMLAPGGIIMFHDYLPPIDESNRDFIIDRKGGSEPGVGEACRELLENQLGLAPLEIPLLYPSNPCQTLANQAIIPGVFSTIRAYRKQAAKQRKRAENGESTP